jgi:hypothetical protein
MLRVPGETEEGGATRPGPPLQGYLQRIAKPTMATALSCPRLSAPGLHLRWPSPAERDPGMAAATLLTQRKKVITALSCHRLPPASNSAGHLLLNELSEWQLPLHSP